MVRKRDKRKVKPNRNIKEKEKTDLNKFLQDKAKIDIYD